MVKLEIVSSHDRVRVIWALLVFGKIVCRVFALFKSTGRGALPLASIRHASVNRPPFLRRLCTECPSFHNFAPNDPLHLLFRWKFSGKIIKFRKKCKPKGKFYFLKSLNYPDFVQFHTQWPPFLGSVTQWPLFCEKIVTDSPLIWCLGRRTPSLICESPQGTGIITGLWVKWSNPRGGGT